MSDDSVSRGESVLDPPSAFKIVLFGQHHLIASGGYKSGRLMFGWWGLWVEQAQIRYVPWISHVLVSLWVLQPIGTSSYDF